MAVGRWRTLQLRVQVTFLMTAIVFKLFNCSGGSLSNDTSTAAAVCNWDRLGNVEFSWENVCQKRLFILTSPLDLTQRAFQWCYSDIAYPNNKLQVVSSNTNRLVENGQVVFLSPNYNVDKGVYCAIPHLKGATAYCFILTIGECCESFPTVRVTNKSNCAINTSWNATSSVCGKQQTDVYGVLVLTNQSSILSQPCARKLTFPSEKAECTVRPQTNSTKFYLSVFPENKPCLSQRSIEKVFVVVHQLTTGQGKRRRRAIGGLQNLKRLARQNTPSCLDVPVVRNVLRQGIKWRSVCSGTYVTLSHQLWHNEDVQWCFSAFPNLTTFFPVLKKHARHLRTPSGDLKIFPTTVADSGVYCGKSSKMTGWNCKLLYMEGCCEVFPFNVTSITSTRPDTFNISWTPTFDRCNSNFKKYSLKVGTDSHPWLYEKSSIKETSHLVPLSPNDISVGDRVSVTVSPAHYTWSCRTTNTPIKDTVPDSCVEFKITATTIPSRQPLALRPSTASQHAGYTRPVGLEKVLLQLDTSTSPSYSYTVTARTNDKGGSHKATDQLNTMTSKSTATIQSHILATSPFSASPVSSTKVVPTLEDDPADKRREDAHMTITIVMGTLLGIAVLLIILVSVLFACQRKPQRKLPRIPPAVYAVPEENRTYTSLALSQTGTSSISSLRQNGLERNSGTSSYLNPEDALISWLNIADPNNNDNRSTLPPDDLSSESNSLDTDLISVTIGNALVRPHYVNVGPLKQSKEKGYQNLGSQGMRHDYQNNVNSPISST